MDKNSVIGLLLIGAIVVGFTFFNSPSTEEIEAAKAKQEVLDSVKTVQEQTPIAKVETVVSNENNFAPKLDANGLVIMDSLNRPVYTDLSTGRDTVMVSTTMSEDVFVEEDVYVIENDKLKLEFTSNGGHLKNAFIKDYKSYTDYMGEKDEFLQLLDSMSNYSIEIPSNGKTINTKDFNFKAVNSSSTSLTLAATVGGKTVEFIYNLIEGSYDLSYVIRFDGFNNAIANQTRLLADFKLKSTEKYLLNEQRNATFYYDDEGSYDYMSPMSDDDMEFEAEFKWIGFKQLFFSAIMMNDNGFGEGSELVITQRPEDDSTYLKNFDAKLNLGLANMSETVSMTWYIGPNDYETIALHGNGSEDIVDLGWGVFRWVNVYFFQPVFKAFLNWGLSAGMAILLLTIFVKLVLSPVNYKMYKSSAMMRVLKPEIEGITKKFPKKEDGMKKQQALMALYKEAGASPLAGCVPMIIQMPVLIAIFRLFPSSIDIRQKSFLWAEDLSTYDQVFAWAGDIPLVTWAYGNHVSLFTLLMAITTLLYTHFNSSNMTQPQQEGMPNMKYIMYFFPFMMIFWFNSYSSGLSFYYFISTLMTMGIMFAIKYLILDEDKIHAKILANKANPKKKKGKSKFSQRLEEAQKLQQERSKNKK